MSDDEYAEVQWNGSDTAVIESQTNPWLKDAFGEPIDLTALRRTPDPRDCETCGSATVVPGVLEAMDTDYGIQRCDECKLFTGDLEAARALAEHIGSGVTVWFHGAN